MNLFEGLNILISIFFECADGFQDLFKVNSFSLILKILTEALLRIHLSVIGRYSLVPTSHWLQGKCARITVTKAASGMILQNHRLLPISIFSLKIVASGSFKRVTGRILKLVSNFKGPS
jgi:hypothetical protein